MIWDSHTHAWRYWPYRPEVPDPESRGRVEQLLWEMDRCGVSRAVLVCARIDHNDDDNDYVAECVSRHPDRLLQFADVDCCWTDTYHRPGAADRLSAAVEQYRLKGFTHYVAQDVEWLESAEGRAFFGRASEHGLVASLSLDPSWQPALRALASRFPSLPILCHHMAGLRAGDEESLRQVAESASRPNVHIKLSGFHYVSATPWGFPYADVRPVVRRLYDSYGPERLCWGSDYPVVRFSMTYRQALESARTHCDFIPPADMDLVLGGNLARLLGETHA